MRGGQKEKDGEKERGGEKEGERGRQRGGYGWVRVEEREGNTKGGEYEGEYEGRGSTNRRRYSTERGKVVERRRGEIYCISNTRIF